MVAVIDAIYCKSASMRLRRERREQNVTGSSHFFCRSESRHLKLSQELSLIYWVVHLQAVLTSKSTQSFSIHSRRKGQMLTPKALTHSAITETKLPNESRSYVWHQDLILLLMGLYKKFVFNRKGTTMNTATLKLQLLKTAVFTADGSQEFKQKMNLEARICLRVLYGFRSFLM